MVFDRLDTGRIGNGGAFVGADTRAGITAESGLRDRDGSQLFHVRGGSKPLSPRAHQTKSTRLTRTGARHPDRFGRLCGGSPCRDTPYG